MHNDCPMSKPRGSTHRQTYFQSLVSVGRTHPTRTYWCATENGAWEHWKFSQRKTLSVGMERVPCQLSTARLPARWINEQGSWACPEPHVFWPANEGQWRTSGTWRRCSSSKSGGRRRRTGKTFSHSGVRTRSFGENVPLRKPSGEEGQRVPGP